MNFENDQAFKKFTSRLARIGTCSRRTYSTYLVALNSFIKFIKLQPSEIIEGVKTAELNPYHEIDDFVGYLVNEDKAPKIINVYFAGVKKFFESNGVFLQRERLKAEVELPRAKPSSPTCYSSLSSPADVTEPGKKSIFI